MEHLSYLAGFFDADGCIRATVQKSGLLSVSVSVVKKNPDILNLFKNHFGVGTVGGYPQYPPYRYFAYFLYSENAYTVLQALRPHLIVKLIEANLAIEAIRIQRHSEPDLERLLEINDQLRSEKRRMAPVSA